ncbi:hypothetical protein [Duganella sp. BuS-21]|uniref:hypothetical protein n=1 Tax=Duganella sp. BuS-21 TaxID=2943848 RepID=UPI0035A5C9AF
MVNIQISLPEDLVRDAEEMGLLKSDAIAEILRAEVRKLASECLLRIADKLAAAGDVPMTPKEVQEEMRDSQSYCAILLHDNNRNKYADQLKAAVSFHVPNDASGVT